MTFILTKTKLSKHNSTHRAAGFPSSKSEQCLQVTPNSHRLFICRLLPPCSGRRAGGHQCANAQTSIKAQVTSACPGQGLVWLWPPITSWKEAFGQTVRIYTPRPLITFSLVLYRVVFKGPGTTRQHCPPWFTTFLFLSILKQNRLLNLVCFAVWYNFL